MNDCAAVAAAGRQVDDAGVSRRACQRHDQDGHIALPQQFGGRGPVGIGELAVGLDHHAAGPAGGSAGGRQAKGRGKIRRGGIDGPPRLGQTAGEAERLGPDAFRQYRLRSPLAARRGGDIAEHQPQPRRRADAAQHRAGQRRYDQRDGHASHSRHPSARRPAAAPPRARDPDRRDGCDGRQPPPRVGERQRDGRIQARHGASPASGRRCSLDADAIIGHYAPIGADCNGSARSKGAEP